MNHKAIFTTVLLLILASQAHAEKATNIDTQTKGTDKDTTVVNNEENKSTPKSEINNKDTLGVTLGYTHNFISHFDIDDPNSEEPDNKPKASFQGSNNSPYITITTGNLAPNDINWQIILEAGHSQFELDTQEYDGDKYNYGTSVEGSHTYIMPQIFYSTSEIGVHPNKERGFRLGGGMGLGLLKAKGTAIYTDKETRDSANPNEVHAVDVNALGISLKLLAEFRYYGFIISTNIKAIIANDTNENNDTYNYSLFDAGLTMGYSLHF